MSASINPPTPNPIVTINDVLSVFDASMGFDLVVILAAAAVFIGLLVLIEKLSRFVEGN